MLNNNQTVCHRHLYKKCTGQNCKLKHYTPQELWDYLIAINCINIYGFDTIKIPYSGNIVKGFGPTMGVTTSFKPKNDMTTKEFLVFLKKNRITSENVHI